MIRPVVRSAVKKLNLQYQQGEAWDLLKSGCHEMDSVQSTTNRFNKTNSVGDIDGKVCYQFSSGDINKNLMLLFLLWCILTVC